ncbi:MAG TPA: phage integrase family protein, partial [Planctomycetaceae bacterium]|nr:phage integrase family protein [Planctomycetaceae bacterium]
SRTGKRRADGQPRKPAAANALRTSLRVFFGFCHEAAWAKRNAARLLRRALCSPPPPRALSEKEMGKLMAALDEAKTDAEVRDRALFRLLAETGMRIGSALGVEVADLDWEGGWVWLRTMKRQQVGRVALPGNTARMLTDWLGERDSGAVFPGMSPRHAQRRFQMWLRRAGLSPAFSPHSLRHSFATRLYRETRDLLVVKEALLHRNLESTLVYARASGASLKTATDWSQNC